MTGRRLSATGTRYAVATPHDAATKAAVEAFEAGGNAIDAGVAAATTLAVTYPMTCGVGGDVFALVRTPDARVVSVNSSGRSPAALDADAVRRAHASMPERGPFTITVPGAVAGWAAVHGLGARLPWSRAFERAIAYATDGVAVARHVAGTIAWDRDVLAADAGASSVFLPDGRPLREGETLVNRALGRTLAELAADGPDALYLGDVGERYARGLRARGCPMQAEDLAGHRAVVLPPIAAQAYGLRILTSPPTSQGFAMLQALAAIERLGLDPDPLGPDADRIALSFVAAGRDRDAHLADPEAMRVEVAELLSGERIEAIASAVRSRTLPEPAGPSPRGGTAGFVVADGEGYAVSFIQSLSSGFGAGILEPSTGIVAHNRGSGFVLDPAHPNALAPGKLPAHTLMPVLALREDTLAAVSGTMGGAAHPQINAASLIRAFSLGMPAAEAVASPRWIAGGMDAIDGVVEVEADVPREVVRALEGIGLREIALAARDRSTGDAHLIVIGEDGRLEVGTDPRADGEAAAS